MDDQDQVQETSNRAGKNKLVRTLVAVAALLLLVVVWLVVYLVVIKDDTAAPEAVNQDKQSSTVADDKNVQSARYASKLWPDLVFDVPKGWQVDEPEDYDTANGEGFVDGEILLRGDGVNFRLVLKTVLATGFEGLQCSEKDRLVKLVGTTYRFVEDGKVMYASGHSESDDDWSELISSAEGIEYQVGHNFCQQSPFIGTYTSSVRQAEHPDASYGYASEENALVWLSAVGEGDIDSVKIQALDAIVASLSSGADVR